MASLDAESAVNRAAATRILGGSLNLRLSLALALFTSLSGMLEPVKASADDVGVDAVGGSVHPMENVPGISMQAEFVHGFAFPNADSIYVECVFYLHNAGAERDILVGFPEFAWGDVGNEGTPFTFFRSYVGGYELQVSRQEEKVDRSSYGFRYWWTKQVHFPAGKTVVLRDIYAAKPGASNAPPSEWLSYTLATGAAWEGPIGSADIIITVVDPDGEYDLNATPAGFSNSVNEFRWHFENFEPSESVDGVLVTWIKRK